MGLRSSRGLYAAIVAGCFGGGGLAGLILRNLDSGICVPSLRDTKRQNWEMDRREQDVRYRNVDLGRDYGNRVPLGYDRKRA